MDKRPTVERPAIEMARERVVSGSMIREVGENCLPLLKAPNCERCTRHGQSEIVDKKRRRERLGEGQKDITYGPDEEFDERIVLGSGAVATSCQL